MLRRRNRLDWEAAAAEFATEAERFVAWLKDTSIPMTLAEVQHRLLSVYSAGIELPEPPVEALEFGEPARIDDHWADAVLQRRRELPFTAYTRSRRPHDLTSTELERGDLCEDLAQVGRHLLLGLACFRTRAPAMALLQWRLDLPRWGAHATDAIRAIQCMLSNLSEDA